jgi:nitronate monooxygenase
MRTRLTEIYRVEWPLAGPGGAFPHSPALTAAVSNAGGLGILGGSPGSPRELASWIRETTKLTSQPFGVELDLQFAQIEHLEECIKGKVSLVIFGWEPPPETWLLWLHHEGIHAWAGAGNLKDAREAVKNGADAVIAHTTDGLRGDHSPAFAMLAGAVQALAPVPVIAQREFQPSRGSGDGAGRRGSVRRNAAGGQASYKGDRLGFNARGGARHSRAAYSDC